VHNTYGDGLAPLPKMVWPTNYGKYACATMFTLFFGGNLYVQSPTLQSEPSCEHAALSLSLSLCLCAYIYV
jgi:hypothetical protein